MRKSHIIGGLTFFLTVISFILLFTYAPRYQTEITDFALKYPFFAPVVIIVWRIIAIIIPPLPGGVISFAFIPAIGWFWAYVYSEIGVLIGASFAFSIARRFREPVVQRVVPLKQIHQLEDKLSKRTEFLAFLGIRIAGMSVMDFISYVAGLSKISYKKFILATIIAELPLIVWYYFGEGVYLAFAKQEGVLGIGILIILLTIIIYFVKNHGWVKSKILEVRKRS